VPGLGPGKKKKTSLNLEFIPFRPNLAFVNLAFFGIQYGAAGIDISVGCQTLDNLHAQGGLVFPGIIIRAFVTGGVGIGIRFQKQLDDFAVILSVFFKDLYNGFGLIGSSSMVFHFPTMGACARADPAKTKQQTNRTRVSNNNFFIHSSGKQVKKCE
jgi:hypothetical protein